MRGSDVWEWDGAQWLRAGYISFPELRSIGGAFGPWEGTFTRHALGFDPVQGAVLQAGGTVYLPGAGGAWFDSEVNDLISIHVTEERRLYSGVLALARQQFAMAYDIQRNCFVVFGGVAGPNYEQPGNSHEELSYAAFESSYTSIRRLQPTPPARARHAMVYDAKRQRTVLFGGVSGDARYDDTWELVNLGPAFTEQPANLTVSPCSSATFHVAVAGDPPQAFHWFKDGQPLTDGGRLSGVLADTLVIAATQFADAGYYSASVTSPCGTNSSIGAALQLTTPWTIITTNGPGLRSLHAMAYDSRRGVTVSFGGTDGNRLYGDTWEWNGNTWLLRATNGPSARSAASMAYDSAMGKIVLVGGNVGIQAGVFDPLHGYRAGTWEWDGVAWTLRTTNGPSGRQFGAIAFDSQANRTVLWGGFGLQGPFRPDSPGVSQVQLADTWEYNGRTGDWTHVADTGPLPSRGAMAYDSQRNRRVLFTDNNGPYGYINTWEWAGTNWTAAAPFPDFKLPANSGMPSKVAGESVAYHAGRGLIILNNGRDPFGVNRVTWG